MEISALSGPEDEMVLCCKKCYNEVSIGQGDGTEFKPGVTAEEYYDKVFAEREF